MNLGKRLEKAIESQNTNINAVAVEAGVNPQTLYSIVKRNNKKVDVEILLKVLDVLNVKFEDLYQDELLDDASYSLELNMKEKRVTMAYRAKHDLQHAVDVLLGVDEDAEDI